MKYLSLFSGIGGFEKAIQDIIPEAECVGFSEIDKYAISVYQRHFQHKNFGDISKIDIENLPDFELLVGGSPCQDLSIAKKDRKGLDGSRSGLFYKYVEILKVKKPKWFILENVNSMPRESKEKISEILGVQPVMINAALVSAQNRKRLFWANFPITQPEDKGILLKAILESGEVDEKYFIQGKEFDWITDKKRLAKKYSNIDGEKAITFLARQYSSWNGQYVTNAMGMGGGNVPMLMDKETAENLKGKYIGNERQIIRKLTPVECARLQCFPDNWCEGISNSQQYKCYGNAVNVEVVKHIIKDLKFNL